jgi:hypothetical protein
VDTSPSIGFASLPSRDVALLTSSAASRAGRIRVNPSR